MILQKYADLMLKKTFIPSENLSRFLDKKKDQKNSIYFEIDFFFRCKS